MDHTQARLWQEGRRAQCDGGWATSLRRMSQPEPATVASTAPASGNPGGHSGANPVLQSSWTSVPVARRRHSLSGQIDRKSTLGAPIAPAIRLWYVPSDSPSGRQDRIHELERHSCFRLHPKVGHTLRRRQRRCRRFLEPIYGPTANLGAETSTVSTTTSTKTP